jgi:hypothetical protein
MCGSNAAGEPLTHHIMFSSEAKEEFTKTYKCAVDFRFTLRFCKILT